MPDDKWPALLKFLHESCASANASHREIGIYCLYTLFEVIADLFMNNTVSLFELFNKLIVDPESKSVRITTVLVLGKLSEFVDSEDKSTIVSVCVGVYKRVLTRFMIENVQSHYSQYGQCLGAMYQG